ncbi:MAG: pilus assembly protein PilV [Alphaproteobacteria bacterium]|nr:pilus assembly protein PilV [Alphaproteobacteria bacterium]
MKKNKINNISGLTLIEILIGVIISTLMMAAMYTTYSIVNNSYSKVVDRAAISRSGRDVVGMMMREIRLAGYKYFGDDLPHYAGDTEATLEDSHAPLIITESEPMRELRGSGIIALDTITDLESTISDLDDDISALSTGGESDEEIAERDALIADKTNNESKLTFLKSSASNMCCDRIDIVYGGYYYDITATEDNDRDKFLRYKIIYQAGPSREPGAHMALYKTKKKWNQESQSWTIEYEDEFLRDFLVDMEFVATDRDGKIIDPPPTPMNSTSGKLYFINSVDIKLTFKSKNELFNKIPEGSKPRLVQGLGNAITNRAMEFFDKFFRDSIVVTVHTRNIGGNI